MALFFAYLALDRDSIEDADIDKCEIEVTFTVNPTQVKDAEGNLVFEQVPVLDELGQLVLDVNGQPTYTNGAPVMETKTYAAGYLNRGLFKKLGVSTFIVGNTANSVTLYREHTGLKVDDVIQLAPGCDQSLKTCHEKFKNAARYGGHPYMPSENPVMNQLIK